MSINATNSIISSWQNANLWRMIRVFILCSPQRGTQTPMWQLYIQKWSKLANSQQTRVPCWNSFHEKYKNVDLFYVHHVWIMNDFHYTNFFSIFVPVIHWYIHKYIISNENVWMTCRKFIMIDISIACSVKSWGKRLK